MDRFCENMLELSNPSLSTVADGSRISETAVAELAVEAIKTDQRNPL